MFVAFSLFIAVFYLILENATNASGESDFKHNIINLPFISSSTISAGSGEFGLMRIHMPLEYDLIKANKKVWPPHSADQNFLSIGFENVS